MSEKTYFKCYELFYRIGKELPVELKAQYYDALMEYGLNGNLPTDPVILSLLQWPIYSIQKSEEQKKQKSEYMKGNKNAVKSFENISKQRITENDREKHIERIRNNKEIKENIIKEKKSSVCSSKLSIPSSSDLVQAYELDTDLHGLFNQRWYSDEWAIEEWINYKQSWTKMTNWKKVSPYTSVRSCLTQLRKYAKVVSPDRLRPDIWPRFRLAVDKAIMKRDGIYWNDTYEKEYLDSKDLKQVEQDFTI